MAGKSRVSGSPSPESESNLVHVHVCVACGHTRRREQIDGREIGSGILTCPKCNNEGPLNVEVRDLRECKFD
jgi:hypothetical protein